MVIEFVNRDMEDEDKVGFVTIRKGWRCHICGKIYGKERKDHCKPITIEEVKDIRGQGESETLGI